MHRRAVIEMGPCATDSKMMRSALLELVSAFWPENRLRASCCEMKRTFANSRIFHIFLHSLTFAAHAADEENGIYIVESMV